MHRPSNDHCANINVYLYLHISCSSKTFTEQLILLSALLFCCCTASLFVCHSEYLGSPPQASGCSPASASHLPVGVLGRMTQHQALYVDSKEQTPVFMLVHQVLCPPQPSPSLRPHILYRKILSF